jgi:hypothetical protein
MRSRLTLAVATTTLALTVAGGLTACSTAASGGGSEAVVSEADLSGTPVTAAEDMTALCEQILAESLPIEAAVALAEASGYATRVSSIDGEAQAVTMDVREDRFTFETEAGLVTACTIG